MTLNELLTSLGYHGSPCYLRRDGDGRFESEFGYGHIFRRAQDPVAQDPQWKAEGVYGIRESADESGRFIPIVYVCTAKSECAAKELHRLLWNQDVAPYVIVHTIQGICVYSGFCYSAAAKKPEHQGVIAALTDFKNAKSIVSLFHRREVDEGRLWQHPHLRIDPSRRVYHRLLASLRELDKVLQKEKLSKEVSHALIGKYVYLRYLRDRGILSDERLAKWELKADDIFGAKVKKSSLSSLTEKLDDWLNGEIFPVPWKGEKAPSSEHIQAIAGAFRGEELAGTQTQGHLDFEAYNFSFIPIETLSLVYEQFLHTEEPKKKKDVKAKKTKGRVEGAYYTPLPLVNFMLAELERQHPLEKGMKVFDPSSGSGSFLVQAYRLLIEKTFPVTEPRPKPGELRTMLEDSIFGCDVDGDACQVTQLSLLLTLLDYVDPPDLTGPMHAFQLPTLCESSDPKKSEAGHTPNILNCNFFEAESALSEAVLGKRGAKADWRKQGFDWIVGNPPWKTISPKKLGENDAPVWAWMQKNQKTMPVGLNQAAQAFAWEAPRYLKADGECALLVPAMGLFEEPSQPFRKTFFSSLQVHTVANFANLAEVLFDGRARVPAAAISYRLRDCENEPANEAPITVFSPLVVNQEATRPPEEGDRGKRGKRGKIWSLSTNSNEIRSIGPSEAASGSGLPWKLAMWGSDWDQRLLLRLEKKWDKIRELEANGTIQIGEGPQLRKTPVRHSTEPSDDAEDDPDFESFTDEELAELKFEKMDNLLKRRVVKTTALSRLRHIFSVPKDALKPNDAAYVCLIHGKSGLEICEPPHILFSAAVTFAIYSEHYFIVPARQLGLISPRKDHDFLKALSLFLSSDFAFYHQFLRSTQLGIQRGRATLESLRQMPIPLTRLSADELQGWTDLHTKLAKCKPRKLSDTKNNDQLQQRDLFDPEDTELDSLLLQLNKMTADALGLSKEERSLIHDLVQVRYALNDGKRGYAAMRTPETKELTSYAKALKAELDDFTSDNTERKHRITIVADDRSAMVEVDFTKDFEAARKTVVLSADDFEAKAFRKTRELLLDTSGAGQWAYFNRNLRIYRGRKIYVFKPLNLFHWTQSNALTDASEIIAETLS